jgi:plasmid stability protein
MATLCIRNVPEKLYAELERWAAASGRSVSDEVLAVLESEAARREQRSEWLRSVQELRAEIALPADVPRPEDIIRDDRDHGHQV